jgi:hypothetical protein
VWKVRRIKSKREEISEGKINVPYERKRRKEIEV